MISIGSTICFYNGDLKTLTENFKYFKPTVLGAVPCMLNKYYTQVDLFFLIKWNLNKVDSQI